MNDAPDGLPPLREVIRSLPARKSLGQNFLCDFNLLRKIARAAGADAGGTFLEIGPGPGGLTRALLHEGAQTLYAIEKDQRFLPVLETVRTATGDRLQIIEGDALKVDWSTLPVDTRVAANLPYGVATPLLLRMLRETPFPVMTLMFQLEVALRLTAPPDSEHYGRLSVMTQLLSVPELLFSVHASAFVPAPNVTSAVVRLIRRADPPACDLTALERLTAAAFGQRRKMLRVALRGFCPDIDAHLEATGIDGRRRAETLAPDDFVRLTCRLATS